MSTNRSEAAASSGNSPGNQGILGASERPTRARYVLMFFLATLAFLTYFDRICITKMQGKISASLGMDEAQMGLIMGAFWLAYALFELPTGWMGDVHGARVTLARIVVAWSLFTALSGSASGFFSLFIYRFLFGVGEAGAFPNMARIQSRWLPADTRARFGGLLWMFARWGGAFSIPLAGFLMRFFDSPTFREPLGALPLPAWIAGSEPWRWTFWTAGLMGVAWVIAFYFWFRDHPSEKASVNRAELELITRGNPPEVRGHSMERSMWGLLFTNRSLLALGMLYLCGSFGWSFFASWMPKYINEVVLAKSVSSDGSAAAKSPPTAPQSGASADDATAAVRAEIRSEWMAAAPHLCGGITCLLGGVLCNLWVAKTGNRRTGRAIFPVTGYIVAAGAMFCVPLVESPAQATILICIAEAAHDFGQGANWASIVDIGGKYAGVAAGMINTIGNMGNAFQPYIGARIKEAYGWNTVFVVYSIAFLLAACMWIIIDPRKTFYGDPVELKNFRHR